MSGKNLKGLLYKVMIPCHVDSELLSKTIPQISYDTSTGSIHITQTYKYLHKCLGECPDMGGVPGICPEWREEADFEMKVQYFPEVLNDDKYHECWKKLMRLMKALVRLLRQNPNDPRAEEMKTELDKALKCVIESNSQRGILGALQRFLEGRATFEDMQLLEALVGIGLVLPEPFSETYGDKCICEFDDSGGDGGVIIV